MNTKSNHEFRPEAIVSRRNSIPLLRDVTSQKTEFFSWTKTSAAEGQIPEFED
jgi:hypothetical protein